MHTHETITALAVKILKVMDKEHWVKARIILAHDCQKTRVENHTHWAIIEEAGPLTVEEGRQLVEAVFHLSGERVTVRLVQNRPPAVQEAARQRRQDRFLRKFAY